MSIELAKKNPQHNSTGNFDDLKKDLFDPDAPPQPINNADPNGPKEVPMLVFELVKDTDGRDMWEATGKTGKKYRIRDQTPLPAPKQGKLTIE